MHRCIRSIPPFRPLARKSISSRERFPSWIVRLAEESGVSKFRISVLLLGVAAGHLSASAADAEGAHVLAGSCTAE